METPEVPVHERMPGLCLFGRTIREPQIQAEYVAVNCARPARSWFDEPSEAASLTSRHNATTTHDFPSW